MSTTASTNKDIHPLHRISTHLTSLADKGVPFQEFLRTVFEELLAPFGALRAALWLKEGSEHIRLCLFRDGRAQMCPNDLSIARRIKASVEKGETDRTTAGARHGDALYLPIGSRANLSGVLEVEISERDLDQEKMRALEDSAQALGFAITTFRSQVDLRERVKELTCLYGIAKLAADPTVSMEDLLQGIVEVLPPAWQYPDITSAQIEVHGQSFRTSGYRRGPQQQRADILVAGVRCGFVEVSYTREAPTFDPSPFLKWESRLINAVANQVALIIEHRQSEQERRKLREQLLHADRLSTIGQLTAGVAHELNEPLANILGFAQLALKGPGLPGETISDIRRIETASLHAREVIRKLMFFSRQMPQRSTSVDLSQVVEDGLYFLSSRCVKAGVDLVQDLARDLPDITVDHSQVNQVLVNLVVNAVQAMPDGGTLTITTKRDGAHALLIVQDTGHGMTEEIKEQIFLPFYTTKDVDKGTGLGLSVVHGIIDTLGGQIDVETGVGEGTCFTIRIPHSSTNKGGRGDLD